MPFGQPGFLWRVPDAHIAMRGLVMAPLLILLVGGTEAFRICAFNAHRLTLAKLTKESVMDTLVQALRISDHYPVEVELSQATPLSIPPHYLAALLLSLLPSQLD
uniref:Deoxyribonuclease 1-like 1 n=2 Tax=Mus musculus TaxID=10090 RepID=I7HPX5_MOUSE|nr:deoxyribonuclease 1-like 1 [Mus musculus]